MSVDHYIEKVGEYSMALLDSQLGIHHKAQ